VHCQTAIVVTHLPANEQEFQHVIAFGLGGLAIAALVAAIYPPGVAKFWRT
jgi:hypothetical protein